MRRYNKNRIWWETVSVPVRVRRCKRRGLMGRVGSKAYKDLSIEQREQLFSDNLSLVLNIGERICRYNKNYTEAICPFPGGCDECKVNKFK